MAAEDAGHRFREGAATAVATAAAVYRHRPTYSGRQRFRPPRRRCRRKPVTPRERHHPAFRRAAARRHAAERCSGAEPQCIDATDAEQNARARHPAKARDHEGVKQTTQPSEACARSQRSSLLIHIPCQGLCVRLALCCVVAICVFFSFFFSSFHCGHISFLALTAQLAGMKAAGVVVCHRDAGAVFARIAVVVLFFSSNVTHPVSLLPPPQQQLEHPPPRMHPPLPLPRTWCLLAEIRASRTGYSSRRRR